ncbi:MAG TPA: pentapeptide repeat-containing protein, partial [Gammaproteobacteria bacterium]|nr:pentapeptide repeat-containing protein [Gammaproteobacteria bacterium]
RTPDGKLWANADRNDLEIQQRSRRLGNSHFAWVALDEEGMPRYGYRLATYEEVQALNYTEFTPVPGKKCTQQFAIYQPKVKWVSEADIKNYFAARRDHYHGSFNDKLGAVARFAGILEDLDLRYCDFSESDFTDAEFINCQLDYCNFSKAHLVRTQWFNTSATHINLSLSQCAYLQAPRINFSHANFNDANFYAANLEDARLTHMTREGAHWDNVRINLEKSPEQDAPTAEQALTQLKEPKLNAHYDADQLLIWLRAQVQAVIATELEKQNFPEPLRTSFALLARNDLHYLNGHQAITFTCALIIKNGLGSEDREKIDRILQRVRATTALERKELRIATELNATDITLTQQAQIKMLLPPLQSHLNTACERLRTECDLSLGLDFSEARVLSLNGWVYETAQNQSVTEQISWQTAIFLGGNDELYTQYLEEVDRQEQPNIRTLLSTFAMPQDLFIQDDTNQSRQLDLQVYEKWQESLYYLARHHHLEWQSRSKMLDQLASKKLIHKQFAHDLLDIWWAWDNRHAHPPSSELLGFTAQLHAFWCQIVNETLSSAATQSSQLSPTEYLLQQAQRKGNWQAYCDYFAWRWTTAQNDVERNEILEGWKKNYTPLYRSQQITLMSVLDKVKSQEGDAYTKLFNHLLDVNDLTGWHYGLIYNRQQWLMRWQNAITSSAEDEVTLETPQLGIEHPASSRLQKHAMVPHVKEQMLDKIANTYTFKTPFQKANGMRDSLHA